MQPAVCFEDPRSKGVVVWGVEEGWARRLPWAMWMYLNPLFCGV